MKMFIPFNYSQNKCENFKPNFAFHFFSRSRGNEIWAKKRKKMTQ